MLVEPLPPAASADAAALVGGRYRLGPCLGTGGMAEVYRAEEVATGRVVALKLMLATDRHGDRLRFRREFQTLARLHHPRIIEVYDYGVFEDRPYYTMELLDGDDFRDLAPAPPAEACRMLRDLASALAFLHSRRLLHRDVSPRNVRCTADGRAKLLDFGVLATMGTVGDIAGALPCIAPEAVLGAPLDQRADLFGLGATAYWLLTGRHARRARKLEDIVSESYRVAAPSTIEPGVPGALDDLVLSLLSQDPLGRPATAAEVMDRLSAIAGLGRLPELEAAQGYVRSPSLVGRSREMRVARGRIAGALEGAGRSMVIRGSAGSGKTRLLTEIGLEAKTAGAVVVRASGRAGGPYALVHELALELARAAPDLAVEAARPHAPVLSGILPELVEGTEGMKGQSRHGADAREGRIELQRALCDWILAVAGRAPLTLLVDNLQHTDEASAVVLASLARAAREHPLLLVAALRTGEAPRAAATVERIRAASRVLRARSLRSQDIDELVRQMFGEVPHLGRLASWIRRAAEGSPLRCVELARHLVDTGVLRYDEGFWVVPEDIVHTPVPEGFTAAMEAHVDALSAPAGALGRILAVYGEDASLELCVAFSDAGEDEVFAALDELTREEILVGTAAAYRFRHEGLREALLRNLDPEERRDLELRVGRVLLDPAQAEPDREARAGWHLLRGGETGQGAALLAAEGTRLFEATSFDDAIPALEAAVEALEALDTDALRLTELRLMLVTAGFYSKREVALRHKDAALEALRRYCGMERIHRYGRVLPAPVAVVLGLLVTVVVHWVTSRRRRDPRPALALRMYLECMVYTAGVAAFSFDTALLRACDAEVAPLGTVPHSGLQAARRFIGNLLNYNLGRLRTLRVVSDAGLATMHEANVRTGSLGISEEELRMAEGGIRYQRGLAAVRSGGPEAFEEIERLEALGPRIWAMAALQLRMMHHMWRGEEEQARAIWAQAELEYLQAGSIWQLDSSLSSSAVLTCALLGDVLGLKRTISALERLVDAGFGFGVHLAAARGEYHRLRGEHGEAEAELRAALEGLPAGEGLIRPWVLSALAQALLDARRFDEAVAAAEAALLHAEHPEYAQVPYRLQAGRTLALAECARGDPERAAERLERLILDADGYDNPFATGSLCEARALVALAARNGHAFELYRLHADAHLRATRNPVLVARAERLGRGDPTEARPSEGIADETPTVVHARSAAGEPG